MPELIARHTPRRNPWAGLLAVLALTLAACDDSPVDPGGGGPDPARALAVGDRHACVLDEEGAAYCWGENSAGQLGTGTLVLEPVPTAVVGGHRFVEIRAGAAHTCALTGEGAAYCWGNNAAGQLGTGLTTSEREPGAVTGGLRFRALGSLGFHHSCGVTEAGEVHCWGGDRNGQLGFPTSRSCPFGGGAIGCSPAPQRVSLSGAASHVSGGMLHSCALLATGAATCWGENSYGQAGTPPFSDRAAPAPVQGSLRFRELAAGSTHTCGLDESGRAFCWGDGRFGSLGTGSVAPAPAPAPVAGGLVFRTLAAARGNTILSHSCGVAADGRAFCWGSNNTGQLGAAAADRCQANSLEVACSTTPREVAGGERWSAVVPGLGFTCGISTGGTAYCWGVNNEGQLGTGQAGDAVTPQPVAGGIRLPRAR